MSSDDNEVSIKNEITKTAPTKLDEKKNKNVTAAKIEPNSPITTDKFYDGNLDNKSASDTSSKKRKSIQEESILDNEAKKQKTIPTSAYNFPLTKTYGNNLTQDYRTELEVPKEITEDKTINFVGMMIGPGGSTQKEMEQSTGTKITVRGRGSNRNGPSQDPDRDMYVLIQSNSQEKVNAGVLVVSELLNNREKRESLRQQQMAIRSGQLIHMQSPYNPYPRQISPQSNRTPFQGAFKHTDFGNNIVEESIIAPVSKVINLSLNNGEAINIAQKFSGATVELNLDHNSNNPSQREIKITGTLEQISLGRKKLQEFMENDVTEKRTLAPNDYIYVPNNVVGIIIGKSGDTIKRLQTESSCIIKVTPEYMTNPEDKERKLHLTGNEEQISNAKYLVTDLVMKHKDSPYTNENVGDNTEIVAIPCGCIGILIGKGGECIRSMGNRTNSKIQVVQYGDNPLFNTIQKSDYRHVLIRGHRAAINVSIGEIQAIVNEHAYRHGYEPPNLLKQSGEQLLGMEGDEYKKYINEMKKCYGMNENQVIEYYKNAMVQVSTNPIAYSNHMKQYQVQMYANQMMQQQQQQQAAQMNNQISYAQNQWPSAGYYQEAMQNQQARQIPVPPGINSAYPSTNSNLMWNSQSLQNNQTANYNYPQNYQANQPTYGNYSNYQNRGDVK